MKGENMTICEKLRKLQTEVSVPKSEYNEYGRFKYRSIEDIYGAIKKPLEELKMVLIMKDNLVSVGGANYIEATAVLKDIESGEEIVATAYAREDFEKRGMDASQKTGCASSYARKYALGGLFCLDDAKDPDSMDNREKATENQIKYLKNVYKGDDLKKLLSLNKLQKIEDISKELAGDLISKIKSKGEK